MIVGGTGPSPHRLSYCQPGLAASDLACKVRNDCQRCPSRPNSWCLPTSRIASDWQQVTAGAIACQLLVCLDQSGWLQRPITTERSWHRSTPSESSARHGRGSYGCSRRPAQGHGICDRCRLPVSVGLYTAFVPMIGYAYLGTSRVLSVSSTTTLAILAGTELGLVVPDGDPAKLVTATATLTGLTGSLLIWHPCCASGSSPTSFPHPF